ncbi:ornithine carbamoyltransferase [Salicibibacter halophilus]|uniref:Ornithine carbamoyltransferase n=1 Tax=Salicibibacter halophilus TaxID=2502791 RepID=A0A514LGG5_9BACI|nr:ornithine carbamoyltransferase [Salicibibacter halophilus]QDI90942.1 ornithine carbamoyltransferase [Salicibibacter halophilus]
MKNEEALTQHTLKGKDVLSWVDFAPEDIEELLESAGQLKEKQKQGIPHQTLAGRSLGMIFENASTRTRVSFEVGMTQLGGHALFLSSADLQIGRGEPVQDTARALSRYVDAIMIRANDHEMVATLAENSDAPVINALTDDYHPCQALADMLTIQEHLGSLKGRKVVYVGDGNNVAHSLMVIAAKFGVHITLSTPVGYEGSREVWTKAKAIAAETGSKVEHVTDPNEAVQHADVVYTDVWVSMGAEKEKDTRNWAFEPYQVNDALMAQANDEAIFMHCLPAHRGEEVSAGVIDGPRSVVFDQAENRLHVQKAILQAVVR